MQWDPATYLKFGDLRLRPGMELLQAIAARSPTRVYDLGCGPGNLTPLLTGRWPEAKIIGVDNSEEMLTKARQAAPEHRFVAGDIADWRPETPPDVIFTNAALQWLGDHDTLFPRLFETLAPGGTLAIQMPRNHMAPSHTCIADAVAASPHRAVLEPQQQHNQVATPADYYDIFAPLTDRLRIWDTEYLQVMRGDNPVADWTRGTALRPFLAALPDDAARQAFEDDYRARILEAYPKAADGATLFPFRRIFIIAETAS